MKGEDGECQSADGIRLPIGIVSKPHRVLLL
jgi:hypothetical protein